MSYKIFFIGACFALFCSTTNATEFDQQRNTGRSATTFDAALYVATNEAFLTTFNKCREEGKTLKDAADIYREFKIIQRKEDQGFHLVTIESHYACV
jgi:hypothetical protein